jgi:hypothetical protein
MHPSGREPYRFVREIRGAYRRVVMLVRVEPSGVDDSLEADCAGVSARTT